MVWFSFLGAMPAGDEKIRVAVGGDRVEALAKDDDDLAPLRESL
ncbi:MAG: hypothetical protein ACKVKM_00370 [Verrucomicrobiia bacterium]|jgi:hypothetical protein|tara:strand:- start:733 stop:864 length:132 start_codon:yes stop_codon:yes gene_type:complete